MQPEWLTVIGFKEEHYAKIEKICRDTKTKDPTFKWKIYPSKFKQYDYILVISSPTEEQAFKSGMWLTRKALPLLDLTFWVKEK